MLGSKEVVDLSEIKQAILPACLNEYDTECDGGDMSDVGDLLDQGHKSKPPFKCLSKSASFPSAVIPLDDNDAIETSLRWIFSEDLTPLKLVSALKGTREKQGLPKQEMRVTWAPDVYDPLPTSVLHTVRGKKQPKSKKNYDKKKNGKKVHKGNNYSRCGNGGSKINNRHFRRGASSSDKWYNYKPPEVDTSGNLDVFKVGSTTDPYCGTSFLKISPTRMLYSVAQAL